MIEIKNVSFVYGTSAATQSMTDSASKDAVGATESQSQPEMVPTLDKAELQNGCAWP